MIWDIALKTFHGIWPILTIVIIVLITARIAYVVSHKEKFCFYKEFWTLFFLIYILLLFQLLTTTEINHSGGINYVPFTEIMRYKVGSKLFIYNVLGNIIIFIPFGYFISSYIKAKKISLPFLVTLIVSASIEFVQLKIGRSFDVDDIILNVLGGVIGYLIYIGLTAIKNHLPKFFQRDLFYNLICLVVVVLLVLYYFGYIKLGVLI